MVIIGESAEGEINGFIKAAIEREHRLFVTANVPFPGHHGVVIEVIPQYLWKQSHLFVDVVVAANIQRIVQSRSPSIPSADNMII